MAQKSLGLEYQRTFETLMLEDYEDYLFSNSAFLITQDFGQHHYAYGLEIQEALKGEFGGLFVFGLCAEYDYKLAHFPISFNVNTFIGGGGGAGAPDGSGLAYRYALGLKAHLSPHFNLLARYSTYDFPTGSIGGKQVQFGFSYGMSPVFNTNLKDSRTLKQSFAVQVLSMDLDQADSGRLINTYKAKLISVEYGYHLSRKLRGLIRLQAVISDQLDGYMAYYSGLSYSVLNINKFSFNLSALMGSSGGGAMKTSGGLGALIEYGLSYTSGNKALRISKGLSTSFKGNLSAYYTQLGFIYNFESTALLGAKGSVIKNEKHYKLSKFVVESGIEFHLAPDDVDYLGLNYTDMTLMTFGIRCPIRTRLELLGQTRWALGGGYGAYAEGIIGLSTVLLKRDKFSIQLPIHMIVAGGSGIDVGKGVGFQINIEGKYAISKTSYISCSAGKMNMIKGNYDPISFNIGLKQDLFFYMK